MTDARELESLVQQVETLFGRKFFDITSHDARANAADVLAHSALNGTYLLLLSSGLLRDGKFAPHRFLPAEFKPFFEALDLRDLSYGTLMSNMRNRKEVRREIVRMAGRNSLQLNELVRSLREYVLNPFYDQETGQVHEDLPEEEKHLVVTTMRIAYKTAAEVLRDVSLELAGPGRYILGVSNGRLVTRGLKETPENVAAWRNWQEKWQVLASHALCFMGMDIDSLDKLVSEHDLWSGVGVISGYPQIGDASEKAANLLTFGYHNREYFKPVPHRFLLTGRKGGFIMPRQSIADLTLIDLGAPEKGFVYKVRHSDGTIALGTTFLDKETGDFSFIQSNTTQLIAETLNPSLDPVFGCSTIVTGQFRDLIINVTKLRAQKGEYERRMQPPDLTTPSEHTVWLPRERIVYNIDPVLSRREGRRLGEIVRLELAPQYVGAHLLKLRHGFKPDPEKLLRAANLSFHPLPNETLRKEHWRGLDGNAEPYDPPNVAHKSKSAMALMFEAKPAAIVASHA